MATTRQQKEATLQELKDKFGRAKSVAFGQYAGISVAQLSQLRKKMREAQVEFKVAKKTLFKLAAKDRGYDIPDEAMEGTIAAAFSYDDAVAGPRIMKQMSKEMEALKLMGGVMEGHVLSIMAMKEIAELPSKEELLAKLVSLMHAPLQNLYGLLQSPLSSFVRSLEAYAKVKGTEASSA